MNKLNCTLCGKPYRFGYTFYVTMPEPIGKVSTCLKCWNVCNGTNIDVKTLERQVKYNERRDRNLNAPIPVNKR